MADTLSQRERSACMKSIRSADTRPELVVRRIVHRLGGRYRLHVQDLPGRPDLVLNRRGLIIFVNGCFWHRHRCPKGNSLPATRVQFWTRKFAANVARDRRVRRQLRAMGWRVITVWECQTRPSKLPALERRLARLLNSS